MKTVVLLIIALIATANSLPQHRHGEGQNQPARQEHHGLHVPHAEHQGYHGFHGQQGGHQQGFNGHQGGGFGQENFMG